MAAQPPPDQPAPRTPPRGHSTSRVPHGTAARRAAGIGLAAACVTALAACGSSTTTSTATTGATTSQLSAARCMRAHGVPNFPDPGPNGGYQTLLSSDGAVKINGITFSGPAFQATEKICQPGGNNGQTPSVPEPQKQALLGFARCMRQHGISQYTNPQFPPGGGIFGGGVSPQAATAPAYKHAATLCSNTRASNAAG
jgi:hypothetical protein